MTTTTIPAPPAHLSDLLTLDVLTGSQVQYLIAAGGYRRRLDYVGGVGDITTIEPVSGHGPAWRSWGTIYRRVRGER